MILLLFVFSATFLNIVPSVSAMFAKVRISFHLQLGTFEEFTKPNSSFLLIKIN